MTTDAALPSDSANEVPPIGSPEFEAYMAATNDTQALELDQGAMAAMPVAEPRELGFQGAPAEPLPSGVVVDAALRAMQRRLDRLTPRHSLRKRFRAAFAAFKDRATREWTVVAVPLARNRLRAEVRREGERWQWDSIAAGKCLYVQLKKDGHVAFRGQVPLSEAAPEYERLVAAFASEPLVGVGTLRALRMAMRQRRASLQQPNAPATSHSST